jgi:hypothetical protein
MSEKFYQLGTHTESDWDSLNAELISQGCLCKHVPERCVTCTDNKPHSPTRGTYLLTDQEAETLKNDPRVKFINVDFSQYPEIYKAPADELHSTSPELVQRYAGTVKNYRRVVTLPNPTTSADINRTGYQLLRCQQKLDPWVDQNLLSNSVIQSNISLYGSGKNIDVIVGDDGMWFGHPEFQNNTIISGTATPTESPRDYVGGNVLPGNGTCDLLDLILDAPYYLDPAWFNASPSTRLITRWDGTIVPVESVARTWWSNASQRSAQFSSAGTVSVTSFYTRAYNNGSNTSRSTVGQHGTPCCALTYGRTQGWAYNANKWALNVYNTNGSDIEQYFDLMKIFHQLKPTNILYGNKNPTISSNSWGYRASKGTTNGYYHFRGVATQYGGVNSEPAFISHMGQMGDAGRWKSEMKTNSYTTALDECIESGVIFVGAAGNSNQKQVGSSHPDWQNRVSATIGQTMDQTSYFEFGLETTGSTNRRGFPQQGGMFDNESNERIYPVINIGALDDDFNGSKETKVDYSDRGEEIDVYAPADGTLAANHTYTSVGNRPDTYSGFTFNGGVATDCTFGGTSAACPVATGLIATVLEHNRTWGWEEVRAWLESLETQAEPVFYFGIESTTATSANWFDYESLEGGAARALYQGAVLPVVPLRRGILQGGIRMNGNLKLKFR